MTQESTIELHLTPDELESVLIQLGARIDALKELQKEAGRESDITRVLEIDKFMIPINNAYQKMLDNRYSYLKFT